MSNSNRVGCNTSSNNLAVMSNNSSTLVNLGRGLNWNTVTHRSRHSSLSISIVTSIGISLWLGLGISLTSDQESLGESNTKEDREELHCLAVFVLRISLPTF